MSWCDNAFEIVRNELRLCYDEFGIVAGKHHYNDYWTRDAGFGMLGALVIGDFGIVRTHLNLLISGQKKDGLIPFLILQQLPILNFFGISIKTPIRINKYRSHKVLFISDVVDSNAYFVIAFAEYLRKTKDVNFGGSSWEKLEKAVAWYFKRLDKKDLLLSEGPIAGWNDGIYKTGKVFISNVLVYKTFTDFDEISKILGKQNKFSGVSKKIKESINQKFFNGRYFSDWLNKRRFNYFDTIANLLSILWDLADFSQASSITDYMEINLSKYTLVPCSYPNYPRNRIEILNRLVGMGDYWGGDSVFWPEPTILYSMVLNKIGQEVKAREVFENLSKKVTVHKGIYEVYDKSLNPLKRSVYKSEYPYARGSGLFLMCDNLLKSAD